MKIVIAPDSYKGSLSAESVAKAIASGIGPGHECFLCPLADGGEGTTAVLEPHLDVARRIDCAGVDIPVFELDGRQSALIESARFVGLHQPDMIRVPIRQRGTTALGEAMSAALDQGAESLVVALGGSATHDMGIGVLTALGARFLGASGCPVTPDLNGLLAVDHIDLAALQRFDSGRLLVLCDVETPLIGPRGATRVFAPQKGLMTEEMEVVEAAVARLAAFFSLMDGPDGGAPRTGAAGGLGFALALLGGELVSGADWLIERCGLAACLAGADWLITGEGRSDAQTLTGKLPLRAAQIARGLGVRTALISGSIDPEVTNPIGRYFERQVSVAWPVGRPATAGRISEVTAEVVREIVTG